MTPMQLRDELLARFRRRVDSRRGSLAELHAVGWGTVTWRVTFQAGKAAIDTLEVAINVKEKEDSVDSSVAHADV